MTPEEQRAWVRKMRSCNMCNGGLSHEYEITCRGERYCSVECVEEFLDVEDEDTIEEECNHCGKPLTVISASEPGVFGVYCSPKCIDAAKGRMAKNLDPRSPQATGVSNEAKEK